MAFYPTILTVEHVGIRDAGRGPLVDLRATWVDSSGERYEVCVQLLSHFACASLVVLLGAGQVGPLALLALAQPI